MVHDKRIYCVVNVKTSEDLARKLTDMSWCLCNGFRLDDYLFLNDSFCENSAQEFAVIHEPTMCQVESITFSWCDYAKSLKYINQTIAGEFEPYTGKINLKTETTEEHGTCVLCA